MPWHRIDKEHWTNDSNKHVFFDPEAKLLCTEAYPTESGLCMVVIPKAILEEILKENRYYLFPEAEFLAMQRLTNTLMDSVGEETNELDWYKDALYRRECKTNQLTQIVMHSESRIEAALQVAEITDHRALSTEAQNRKLMSQLKQAVDSKMEIIKAGQKEIDGLREEIRLLKEKYENNQ